MRTIAAKTRLFFCPRVLPQLASSTLLQLGQNVERMEIKNRESIYLLLHMVGVAACRESFMRVYRLTKWKSLWLLISWGFFFSLQWLVRPAASSLIPLYFKAFIIEQLMTPFKPHSLRSWRSLRSWAKTCWRAASRTFSSEMPTGRCTSPSLWLWAEDLVKNTFLLTFIQINLICAVPFWTISVL